jgi:hypothetical protein
MVSPNAPIPAGTLCKLAGVVVRVYPKIWPGETWDERYLCRPFGQRDGKVFATRDQLEPIGGGL